MLCSNGKCLLVNDRSLFLNRDITVLINRCATNYSNIYRERLVPQILFSAQFDDLYQVSCCKSIAFSAFQSGINKRSKACFGDNTGTEIGRASCRERV